MLYQPKSSQVRGQVLEPNISLTQTPSTDYVTSERPRPDFLDPKLKMIKVLPSNKDCED